MKQNRKHCQGKTSTNKGIVIVIVWLGYFSPSLSFLFFLFLLSLSFSFYSLGQVRFFSFLYSLFPSFLLLSVLPSPFLSLSFPYVRLGFFRFLFHFISYSFLFPFPFLLLLSRQKLPRCFDYASRTVKRLFVYIFELTQYRVKQKLLPSNYLKSCSTFIVSERLGFRLSGCAG